MSYLSNEKSRDHIITLLLLDSDGSDRRHYVWVKNLSRLVSGRSRHDHKTHVCLSCLQPFTSERVLADHSRCCLMHKPQQVVYPDPNDANSSKLSFRSHFKQFPFAFYLVTDFEAFLTPSTIVGDDADGHKTRIIDTHEVSGFCIHRVCQHSEFQTPPFTYNGPNPIDLCFTSTFSRKRELSPTSSRVRLRCTR